MLISESTKRKPRPKKRHPTVAKPSLSSDELQQMREFVRFGIGDGHLTCWEEGFLNSIKSKVYNPPAWLSEKEQNKVRQIREKLHFDQPDAPLPAIDPDGIVENGDPVGWPAVSDEKEWSDDDELPDLFAEHNV